jgi:hypothetical protein
MDVETLSGPASRVSKPGADPAELAGFLAEALCMAVDQLNPAIDPAAWKRGRIDGDRPAAVSRPALCFDVAPDLLHATLAAAALLADGRIGVWIVGAWDGPGCVDRAEAELGAQIVGAAAHRLGWIPNGPAAAAAAKLADRRKAGRYGWPPRGVTVEEIRGEVTAVCMGFAEQVTADRIAHTPDPLLDDQVGSAEPLKRGDAWVFSRAGEGHVDAVYAAAGAVHLARTAPTVRPVSRRARGAGPA